MNKITGLFFGVFFLFGSFLAWTGGLPIPDICWFAPKQGRSHGRIGSRGEIREPPPKGLGCMRQMAVSIVTANISGRKMKGTTLTGSGVRGVPWRGITCSISRCFSGTSRLGADLTNVGVRQTDPQWFYRLLYNPQSMSHEVSMPAYRWLFETREIQGQPSVDAVKLQGANRAPSWLRGCPHGGRQGACGISAFAEKELPFAGSS